MEDLFNGNVYYLVRHGEAANNVQGILNAVPGRSYPLTERGVRQIEQLAGWFKEHQFPINFVVTSPILRAKQTALLLSQRLSHPVSMDERLAEARFGVFEGEKIQTFLEFMHLHGGRVSGEPRLGVEGYMDIRERTHAFLVDLSQAFRAQHIVLVSHADILQELFAGLMGEPVGAEQGNDGWAPHKGSVAVLHQRRLLETFVPSVD